MRRPKRARGIPTAYMGTRFRSRLEARWAAFFDELDWEWDYEPIDLDSYIPDFHLPGLGCIVECKSVLALSDPQLIAAQTKIEKSGWVGDAIVVGASLLGRASFIDNDPTHTCWLPWRIARGTGDWYFSTTPEQSPDPMHTAWLKYLWQTAGNTTQWKKPR